MNTNAQHEGRAAIYTLQSGGSTHVAALNGKPVDWTFVLDACNQREALRATVRELVAALGRYHHVSIPPIDKSAHESGCMCRYHEAELAVANARKVLGDVP